MLVRRACALGVLCLVTLCSTPADTALAHGEPPTAYAVVAHDADGATAVRLSTGLALRRAQERFQFVCPAAWGDEYAAPLAALDDGTIVVGASSGLKLLAPDGSVRAHPDANALGISTELVRASRGVFALRVSQRGSELLAVSAESVRVLWSDTRSWYSLGAQQEELVLLRSTGMVVEQLRLSTDGGEIERQLAMVSSPVDYSFVRASGDSSYALLLYQTAPELGSLRMNGFVKVADAASSIAGPLTLATRTLLALDGQLSSLQDGTVTPLPETSYVLCLERNAGLAYACLRDGLASVSESGLAAPLFKLSWLTAPKLEQLAEGKPRDRCDYQWQDMRFDLLALGTPLPGDVLPEAGAPEPELDAGSVRDDTPPDESVADADLTEDAGSELEPVEAKRPRSDCTISHTVGSTPRRATQRNMLPLVSVLVLVLVLVRRARARARARARLAFRARARVPLR